MKRTEIFVGRLEDWWFLYVNVNVWLVEPKALSGFRYFQIDTKSLPKFQSVFYLC